MPPSRQRLNLASLTSLGYHGGLPLGAQLMEIPRLCTAANTMKTDELREKYLAFFESKGHTRCASDVLVPTWDSSVLFTPAGMNQFKDHFLGKVKLEFTRATSCQKCMRTGDIDNVGRTARHHTFFEMLGNFSFGDYFKRDAIHWAWEFLTDKKWMGIDKDLLTVTVYQDDDEAAGIWENDIHVPMARIQRMGEQDNFWPAGAPSDGPDGVCGPCSEIFYHAEGDLSSEGVEIWNLVFTQFNRIGDPPDNLRPLPSRNIDTGMGLERAAAMLQGVDSNFHIDILRPLVEAAGDVCSVKYEPPSDNGRRLRRIADHIRACAFAVHENVYPGPNKEKYVIKRLLRRAVLDGRQLGLTDPFLYKLVRKVADLMAHSYPELQETTSRVEKVIRKEEENFFSTIDGGLERIHRVFLEMSKAGRVTVDGVAAAELYQTYGVPPELFESLAADGQLAFDWDGYQKAMEQHGEASGKAQHVVMGSKGPMDSLKQALQETHFVGYEVTETQAIVKGIVAGTAPTERLCESLAVDASEKGAHIVIDCCPFYGESGGQVGDIGVLTNDQCEVEITDTQRDGSLFVLHGNLTRGTLQTGATMTARVDKMRREAIRRAHSATHILHYALQKNLGSHAQQQGSKVDSDWLRFDFTNLSPVTAKQMTLIEQDVEEKIASSDPIKAEILPLADARQAGAMMLFGEKYPDPVRMVSMGEFSKELCGGTHLTRTSDVSSFEVLAEEGVSAGTRRIVAVTGERANQQRQQAESVVAALSRSLGVGIAGISAEVQRLTAAVRGLKKRLAGAGGGADLSKTAPVPALESDAAVEYVQIKAIVKQVTRILNVPQHEVLSRVEAVQKEVEKLRSQLVERSAEGDVSAESLIENAVSIGDTNVVVEKLVASNPNLMRQLIDQIRKRTTSSAVFLATSTEDGKVILVAGVSHDLVDQGIKAGDWVKKVAPVVGGGGGGKPDMAQAGGKEPDKLPQALEEANQWIRGSLGIRGSLAD